jgi:hypothetical protein
VRVATGAATAVAVSTEEVLTSVVAKANACLFRKLYTVGIETLNEVANSAGLTPFFNPSRIPCFTSLLSVRLAMLCVSFSFVCFGVHRTS